MRSFYKDWSGTSPRPDRTTELVKSSLEHPRGLTKQSCPQDQTGRAIENPDLTYHPPSQPIYTLRLYSTDFKGETM